MIAGLAVVMCLTLVLPFSVKRVEEELEAFLFVMGLAAVTISGLWSLHLVKEALKEPLAITAAVAIVGWLFKLIRPRLSGWIEALTARLGISWTIFILVTVLGLGSSVFTAIVAAIMLAEIVTLLKLNRDYEIKLTVYACYAIGLGAALTPLGEPLSTIVVAKLKGPPHFADFFYLAKQVGVWIVPGVLLCAALAARGAGSQASDKVGLEEDAQDSNKDILLRALKVYIFVMALIFLGSGLTPLAERYIVLLPTWALYWVNSVSAILDNATLAAAEIAPSMTDRQITFILMGLLVSGGMLIPGNIPNIVSSAKLGIKSREWAKAALPFGGALMLLYFVLMTVFVK
ncbi:MAG: cation transporter [Elusimicrobia bacterium GWB2_63_22]|nr:MAG: cation transporter [Elusimicrobia bacterium GWB2_63_22]